MLKKIVAVLAAFAIATMVFMAFEYLNHLLFPFIDGMEMSDKEALAAFVAERPAMLLLVLAGWVTGSFIAGWVVVKISGSESIILPLITGVILTLCGVLNFLMIPHPLWFVVIGTLTFIPMTLSGYFVAKKRKL